MNIAKYDARQDVSQECVTDSAGSCQFTISEADWNVKFHGLGEKISSDRYATYGPASGVDPKTDCKVVFFRADPKAKKIYKYAGSVKQCPVTQHTIYDNRNVVCTEKEIEAAQTYGFYTNDPVLGLNPTKPTSPEPEEDDFIEEGEVDFAILNVVRPRYGKNKRTGVEQLQFEEQLRSDSEVKESVSLRSECFMHTSAGEKVTMALSTGIQDIPPGRYTYKVVMPVADEGKELFQQIKKKKGSFTCDFDLPGYYPAEMADELVTTVEPDADMSNNFFRATVQWKGKKLKIISTTRVR